MIRVTAIQLPDDYRVTQPSRPTAHPAAEHRATATERTPHSPTYPDEHKSDATPRCLNQPGLQGNVLRASPWGASGP